MFDDSNYTNDEEYKIKELSNVLQEYHEIFLPHTRKTFSKVRKSLENNDKKELNRHLKEYFIDNLRIYMRISKLLSGNKATEEATETSIEKIEKLLKDD